MKKMKHTNVSPIELICENTKISYLSENLKLYRINNSKKWCNKVANVYKVANGKNFCMKM